MIQRVPKVRKPHFYYDSYLLIVVFSMLLFGLLMVGSASMVVSDKLYGFSLYFVIKQFVFVVMSVFLALVVTRVPTQTWLKFSGILLLLGLFFLLLVLIPGIGRVVNGSRRWIRFGVISLQVSEFMKLAGIVYLSGYLARYKNQVTNSILGFIKPMAILSVIGILLLLEPDFGTLMVITITFLGLLFIAGARLWPFVLMVLFVVVAMTLLAIMSPYRLARLTTFIHPWSHAFGSGYQLTQSLIAFGRGGVLGVGLGNSIQKLFYLPEAHSDFVFAVIAEELGLVGECILIGLFVALIVKLLMLGRRCALVGNLFSSYVCYGMMLWLACQAMINMGVNAGILPTKGLTLPFISYGGSSMMVSCVAIGLLLRISYELKLAEGTVTRARRRHCKEGFLE